MSHIDIVRSLIAHWQQGELDAVLALLADDIEFHYLVGAPPLTDKQKIRRFFEAMAQQQSQNRWRIIHYAENGPLLLVEGIEDFVNADGHRVQVPYMGAFEIRDGKIVRWRDYLDPALMDRSARGETHADWIVKLLAELDSGK